VNRELLKARARVVWLKVDPDEAATRLGPEGISKRPLLNRGSAAKRLRDLLESRRAVYAAAADVTIETGELTPADVAVRIVSLLGPIH
jgi:shikimate dehydrogenase